LDLLKDLLKAFALTAFLLLIHDHLEDKPSGRYLRQFEFELLQESLRSGSSDDAAYEAGGEKLPLVVDISLLHPDKDRRSDRKMLDKVVTALTEAGAGAIGIDLDFADGQAEFSEDYQYLAKWQGYNIVRVGVYARSGGKSAEWLGRPEFAEMAAGIALPSEDPEHAFLYIRSWHPRRPRTPAELTREPHECRDPPDANTCKADLPELPLAMWLLIGRDKQDPKTAFQDVVRRSQKREVDDSLDFGEYPIDYSYLREIRKEIISLKSPEEITVFTSRIRNRSVVVADLNDAKDRFCYIGPHEPLSGALIHACTLASLNRGFFGEVTETLSVTLKLGMTLLVLFGIMGLRLIHTYSRPLRRWDYQYLEILAFTLMSILTYFVFNYQIRTYGILWPDWLWVCAALFIHPFLTEPFYRTCRALPKVAHAFVIAFAASGPGGKDEP
jgi:hypothetical protein